MESECLMGPVPWSSSVPKQMPVVPFAAEEANCGYVG